MHVVLDPGNLFLLYIIIHTSQLLNVFLCFLVSLFVIFLYRELWVGELVKVVSIHVVEDSSLELVGLILVPDVLGDINSQIIE